MLLFIPNKQYLHVPICSCQVVLLFTSPSKLAESQLNKSSPNFLEWGTWGGELKESRLTDIIFSNCFSGVVSGPPPHINVTPESSICGTRVDKPSLLRFKFFLLILIMILGTCVKIHPDTEKPRKVNT